MRRHIITQLTEKGIHVHEKALTIEDAADADEIFLSNAVRQIKWVGSFNLKTSFNNTHVRQLYSMLYK